MCQVVAFSRWCNCQGLAVAQCFEWPYVLAMGECSHWLHWELLDQKPMLAIAEYLYLQVGADGHSCFSFPPCVLGPFMDITKLRVEDMEDDQWDAKSMARLWACSLAGHSWAYIREDTHAGQVALLTCWLLLSSSRLGSQATNHLAPRLPSCSSACRRENNGL